MSAHLPVFGPTETMPCDDDATPFVRLRVELVVSREQLRAALAIGHAELAGEPPLPELAVDDIRREIEGHFAACASVETDQEADRLGARLSPQLAAELDAAIDRAYPTRPAVAERTEQGPEYGPGTVTLDTLDHGRITIDEPAWCAGHEWQSLCLREEISHVSTAVAGVFAGVEFLPARITSGPFAAGHEVPVIDIDEFPSMTSDELRDLASAVGLHAGRLYSKANELDRIHREAP